MQTAIQVLSHLYFRSSTQTNDDYPLAYFFDSLFLPRTTHTFWFSTQTNILFWTLASRISDAGRGETQ